MLLRHALSSDLDVVLPENGWSFYRLNPVRFSYVHKFFRDRKEFDMFALHARFTIDQIKYVHARPGKNVPLSTYKQVFTEFECAVFRKLLGYEATFVTILRHPVTVFESSYAYYQLGERVYHNMTFPQFIRA